jgi:hypothetical protein
MAKPANKSNEIRAALMNGEKPADVATRFGITKSSVSYHTAKIGKGRPRTTKYYDWSEIRAYLENHGVRQTIRHFGISRGTFSKAVDRGDIANRPIMFDPTDIFIPGKSRSALKRGLRLLGVEYRCSILECGASSWLGRPIALQLDHISGDNQDNRPTNLRLLCPNCHSQTDTCFRKEHEETVGISVMATRLALTQ